MRKHILLLAILAGSTGVFSSGIDTTSSFPRILKSKLTMYHLPDVATTSAGGAFTTQIAFQGKIVDSTRQKKGMDDVNVTLPYYGQSLTATTNDYGEFITTKIAATGTVVNAANEPVAGAWVAVKSRVFKDSADAAGLFSNGGTIGTIVPFSSRQQQAGTWIAGSRLFVAAAIGERVEISLFSMKGERCFFGSIDKLSNELHTLHLPQMATGSYIMKVAFGGNSTTFRRPFFTSGNLTVQKSVPQPKTSSGILAKRSAVVIADTLVAFADGYLAGYLPIPAGQLTGLKITLESSTSWKPAIPSDIQRQGSLVRILAKDKNFSMGQPLMVLDDITTTNWESEGPVHKVSFTYDFWMDSTEITQKQFQDITKAAYKVLTYTYVTATGDTVRPSPTNYSANLDSVKSITGITLVKTDTSALPQPGWTSVYGLADNVPSYFMSYHDAMMFCNARSKAESLDTVYSYSKCINPPGKLCALKGLSMDYTRNGYRLPTEAEWEYACRGGTETDYFWKKNYSKYPSLKADTTEIGQNTLWGINANKSSEASDYGMKSGAASKLPNKYGLYDMSGSCSEWTSAPLSYATYTAAAAIDPKPTTAAGDTVFTPRGGNWGNDAPYLRSACRIFVAANYFYWHLGFRTVREVR